MASVSEPAEFDLLNNDTLGLILQFHGRDTTYLPLPFGILNKRCLEIFHSTEMAREKFYLDSPGKGVFHYGRRDVLDWALQEKNQFVLGCIFEYVADERRLDILTEIPESLEYIDSFKEGFSEHTCISAASRGHLDVSNGLSEQCYERYSDVTAGNGH